MTREATDAVRLPFDREGFAEVSEVADYLSLSTTSVYELLAKGTLPHARIVKNAIRVPRKAVVAYMNQKMEEAANGAGSARAR